VGGEGHGAEGERGGGAGHKGQGGRTSGHGVVSCG
jgi:hypothetical protein